jgi:hypothetical protein
MEKLMRTLLIALCLPLLAAAQFVPSASSGGGSGWPPSAPAASAPPTLAAGGWSFINTSSAGSDKDVTGGVLLNSVTGNDIKQLTLPTPGVSGSAFTMTAHITTLIHDPLQTSGVVVGVAGDAKIHVAEYGPTTSGPAYRVSDWNSSTSFAATVVNYTQGGLQTVWWRIKYTGTGGNLIFSISPTGNDDASFMVIYTVAASAFLSTAPTRIGFFAYSQVTGNPVIAVLDYWFVTQP